MIVFYLQGRIGNQLFMYAMAEAIRHKRGLNEKIVFYDEDIVKCGWKNSLEDFSPSITHCVMLSLYIVMLIYRGGRAFK